MEGLCCRNSDARGASSDQDGLALKLGAEVLVFDDLESCWTSVTWTLRVLVNFDVSGRHDCGRMAWIDVYGGSDFV